MKLPGYRPLPNRTEDEPRITADANASAAAHQQQQQALPHSLAAAIEMRNNNNNAANASNLPVGLSVGGQLDAEQFRRLQRRALMLPTDVNVLPPADELRSGGISGSQKGMHVSGSSPHGRMGVGAGNVTCGGTADDNNAFTVDMDEESSRERLKAAEEMRQVLQSGLQPLRPDRIAAIRAAAGVPPPSRSRGVISQQNGGGPVSSSAPSAIPIHIQHSNEFGEANRITVQREDNPDDEHVSQFLNRAISGGGYANRSRRGGLTEYRHCWCTSQTFIAFACFGAALMTFIVLLVLPNVSLDLGLGAAGGGGSGKAPVPHSVLRG